MDEANQTKSKTIKVELDGNIEDIDEAKAWVLALPEAFGDTSAQKVNIKVTEATDKKIIFNLTCDDTEKCSPNAVRSRIDDYRIDHQEPFYMRAIRMAK